MTADAYLFRHQLVRDAAYELHLPQDRTRLHAWVLDVHEVQFGAPPPHTPALVERHKPHALDTAAASLAEHARHAGDSARMLAYLWRAGLHARFNYRSDDTLAALMQIIDQDVDTPVNRCEAFRLAADAHRAAGRHLAARPLYEAALELAAGARERGLVLERLGGLLRETGEMKAGEKLLRSALALHREAGNRHAEGMTLRALAVMLQELGRMDEAMRTNDEALAIHREVGNGGGLAASLDAKGNFHLLNGDLAQAEANYQQALEAARKAGAANFEGSTLGNLAIVYSQTGRHAESEKLYLRAIEIAREMGNTRSVGVATGNLATLYHGLERMDEARSTYETALAIAREVGNPRAEATDLGHYAKLLGDTGSTAGALEAFDRALAIHRRISHRRGEGVTLGHRAELLDEVGDHAGALQGFDEAMALHAETRNQPFLAIHGTRRAIVLARLGRPEEAAAQWEAAFPGYREMTPPDELEETLERMRQACASAGLEPLTA